MFVKGPINLSRGFEAWKNMVQANEAKMKKIGFRIVYAGTSVEDDSQLTVIMHFDSPQALEEFKNNAELTRERIEAGVIMETSVMTPMTDLSIVNFPG